jgi:hypothetical protein
VFVTQNVKPSRQVLTCLVSASSGQVIATLSRDTLCCCFVCMLEMHVHIDCMIVDRIVLRNCFLVSTLLFACEAHVKPVNQGKHILFVNKALKKYS